MIKSKNNVNFPYLTFKTVMCFKNFNINKIILEPLYNHIVFKIVNLICKRKNQ